MSYMTSMTSYFPYIGTAINKWRKRLRACIRAKGRHIEH